MIEKMMTKMAYETVKMPTKYPEDDFESKEWPQHFDITTKQVPQVKGWRVGESYTMLVKVKQDAIREKDNGEQCATMLIEEITPLEGGDVSSYFTE